MVWLPKRAGKYRKGLRYKLMLAFSLMSIIPLLTCTYLITVFLFPNLKSLYYESIVLLIAIGVSFLGFAYARTIIEFVIGLAAEVRVIAGGEYDRKVTISTDDEISFLGDSINVMTDRIKTNLDDLRSYGQKTREINADIQKKILGLSNLLQIGDVISKGAVDLDAILELAVQKAATIFDGGFSILYMIRPRDGDCIAKVFQNIEREKLIELTVKETGHGLFDNALRERAVLIIDDGVKESKEIEAFREKHNVRNLLAVGIFSGKRTTGLLVVGTSQKSFKFKVDDIDLVKVYARQIAIAVENDSLLRRTEELAVVDELTGMYNKNFIFARIEEEIKRAIFYQRPCALLLFDIDDFRKMSDIYGPIASEEVLRRFGRILKENATPMGKVARISGNEFAILLPEKNKKEAFEIAEDICRRVESTVLSPNVKVPITVSGGVSENPIDGSTQEELFRRATEALRDAKASGKNRISS